MTSRRLLLATVAAALAIVLAIRLRRSARAESVAAVGAQAAGPAETRNSTAAEAGTPAGNPETAASLPEKKALHGLRLLDPAVATKLGWIPKERPGAASEPVVDAVVEKWHSTKVDLNATDQPLPDLLDGLRTRYGLETRIDPEIDATHVTVTFKVSELAADQTIDLVLKMADLAHAIDATGTFWVTTRERVDVVVPPLVPKPSRSVGFTAGQVRYRARETKSETSEEKRAVWMKDRKVSVSIANRPLVDAVEELAKAGGLRIYSWTVQAQEAAERAPIVSVVGDDLPLDRALDDLLVPAGLELAFWLNGQGEIQTKEQGDEQREFWKQVAESDAEHAKEVEQFRARRVRIEGPVLSLENVGTQLEAQLGVHVRIVEDLEFCPAAWESDGLEQSAGEVLDILARGAPLVWDLTPEIDPEEFLDRPEEIWLVSPK